MGFLSPYRVLDLTNERGLLAGKIFADLGADVIQVEPLEGSSARSIGPFYKGESLFWEAYSCNKRGITCDLDKEEGKDLLLKLCKEADFLFQSELPGIMEKRGLSYQDFKKINPNLIYVSITPFGSEGPKSHYVDSDIVLWAAGGALYPNQENGRPPVRVTLPQSYMHAAADAAGGALIAHHARLKSGRGQHVEISIQRSVAQSTLSTILAAAVGDKSFGTDNQLVPKGIKKRVIDQSGSGNRTARTKWKVKDGYVSLHLSMGPATGRFSNNLMKWLCHEGAIDEETAKLDWIKVPEKLSSGEMDWDEIDTIYDIVASFLLRFSKMELIEMALKWKVVIAPVFSFEDLVRSPHHEARKFWIDIEGTDGRRLRLPGPFARTSNEAFEFKMLAPKKGEHSYDVLTNLLNLSKSDIRDLKEKGVIS